MKKLWSSIGFVLVLSLFGLVQNAAAFEPNDRQGHASKGFQPSRENHSSQSASRVEFRGDQHRQEARFQQAVHYEHRLPAGYRTLHVANMLLYYLNGLFYQSTPYGYQVVNAPMGTIVRDLPLGYYQVQYGGTPYYVYNNTYYVQGPMGYSIVTPPSQGMLFPAQSGW